MEAAKKKKIRYCNASKRIPENDDSVDLIYSCHMIEHLDMPTLEHFLKLWGNVSPYKIKQSVENQNCIQDIIIARSSNDYIHGLYVYSATPKIKFEIEHLIIPGPIARQTILKQFIEHMIRSGLDLQCSVISIYHLNENDWRSLFLQEAGAKRVKPDCLQINLFS